MSNDGNQMRFADDEAEWDMVERADAADDLYFCQHDSLSLPRARMTAAGVRYYRQCLSCGRSAGNACRKDVAMAETNGSPQAFNDIFLNKCLEEAKSERVRRLQDERDRWWAWYNEYLQSVEWRNRRQLVIERCDSICEGCRRNVVVEVHHKTYAHVGRELLFELVGLCADCHSIAHQDNQMVMPDSIRLWDIYEVLK